MTASNYLHIIAIGLVVIGWGTRAWADDDVTIVAPANAASTLPGDQAVASDGTPVIHKSFHKNKDNSPNTVSAGVQALGNQAATTKTWSVVTNQSPITTSLSGSSSSLVPVVQTGLPIARHSIVGSTTVNDSASIPTSATLPSVSYGNSEMVPHKSLTPISTTVASYLPPVRTENLTDDFPLTSSPGKKGPRNTYPWKMNIITTMFWIGEGGSTISPTDNVKSSWDEEWVSSNSGSDSPNARIGYAPARHAATVNPFYVALPFNDLAFPDKTKRWLPTGWHRASKDGKQVSACKDRWVEIKAEDGSGHTCYAQWEDVGPLRYDHAEYVFGPERPIGLGDNHAGLDVSPAVAQYLHLDSDKKALTRWRFVDAEDVPPGEWLRYGEEAVIYQALHEMRKSASSLPIQKSAAPIDDASSIESNEKKVNAHKG